MKIDLFHVGIATCVLSIDNQVKIAIDPALFKKGTKLKFKSFESERLKNPIFDNTTFEDIDIWLITHSHGDHVDILGKEKISKDSLVLSNKDSLKILAGKNLKEVSWKEKYIFSKNDISIEIEAIPAYHASSLLMRKLVGKVNGYLLTITSDSVEEKIYFTSDTVFHEDIVKALPKNVDVLIANLGNVQANKKGGPLTMNISMLDKFVEVLNPRIVVPIHIDDFSHYDTREEEVIEAGYTIFETGKWYTLLT